MTFQERYKYNPTTDLLGKGGFARVYKATDVLLDREVAIKVFNATDKGQYTVIEEIKKAIRLQHPNLLRYYDVAVVENNNALGEVDTLQIGVMELANAGDLKQFAKENPNSPMLFTLLQQVLSGLEYLHSKGIIHRDMKPQNILLVEEDGVYTAKISDFGISKSLDSGTNSASMAIGTIEYMAPEQFSPAKYGVNGKIGTNVDLWSFGIMVHELITNQPVFGQRNGNTTAEQIMNAILSQSLPSDVENLPEPYKTVVKRCLVSDAKERIQKAKEVIQILDDVGENKDFFAETMQIDKNLINKANESDNSETVIIPRPKQENKQESKQESKKESKKEIDSSPVNEVPPTPIPKPAKKNTWVYLVLFLFIVGGVFGYWFLNKDNLIEEAKTEYAIGLKSKIGSDEYLKRLEKAAKMGLPEANLSLANYYFEAFSNPNQAAPYIEKLIIKENGNVTSTYPGVIAMYAVVLEKMKNKPQEAFDLAKKWADKGDTDAAYQLALFYYEGKVTKLNYDLALQWFEKASEKNNNKAQTMLGNMYLLGQGVKENSSLAIQYYFRAKVHGNMIAMYAVALAYKNGNGVEKNMVEANKLFKMVAENALNKDVVKAAQAQLLTQ